MLDEFSELIKARIFKEFPDWMVYMENMNYGDGLQYLVIKIPPPSSNFDTYLIIETCDEEISISIDNSYSAHFSNIGNETYNDAFVFLHELINENIIMISFWQDNMVCGTTLKRRINYIPSLLNNSDYPSSNLIRVRSWLGSYDTDMQLKT